MGKSFGVNFLFILWSLRNTLYFSGIPYKIHLSCMNFAWTSIIGLFLNLIASDLDYYIKKIWYMFCTENRQSYFLSFSASIDFTMGKSTDDGSDMMKTIIIAVCSAGAYLALVIALTAYCSYRLLMQRKNRKATSRCQQRTGQLSYCIFANKFCENEVQYKSTD